VKHDHIKTSKSGPNSCVLKLLTSKYGIKLCTFSILEPLKVVRICNFFCLFWFGNVFRVITMCAFSTLEPLKVVLTHSVLYILTWKCASYYNDVYFFGILTSKSGPTMVCFVYFNLEMCFAPQRRVIFHLSSGQLAPYPPL